MKFQVLGDIAVTIEDRSPDLGGPKQRLLLAALLTSPSVPLTRSLLVDLIWDGESAPARPEATLRTYVSRLRKIVGDDRVISRHGAYGLLVVDGELDADRYRHLVAEARRRRSVGDAGAAIDLLDEADQLWRGEPWAEFSERPWALPLVETLRTVHIAAVTVRADVQLDIGDPASALETVTAALTAAPTDDGLRRIQMIALHRSGRSIDATRAFQEHRRVVADETGLEPAPDLARLEQRILAGDELLSAAAPQVRGYRLIEKLAAKPASTVWLARHATLDRDVAVEVLDPTTANDPEVIRSFDMRARILSAVDHPHLVPVIDAWRDHNGAIVVTPLMPPVAGTLGPGDAARMIGEIGEAIVHLGSVGVPHRPLEPGDVRVAPDGSFCLAPTMAPVPDVDEASQVVALARLVSDLIPTAATDAPPLATVLTAAANGEVATLADLTDLVGARTGVGHRRNPFKGLAAFDVGDSADFFGRKDVVAELVERVAAQRLVSLVGPSGSGKSSVVRAGVLPELAERAELGGLPWFGVAMVPGVNPFDGLADGLRRIAVSAPDDLDQVMATDNGVVRAAEACLPDPHSDLLVVLDQFEELYTLTDPDTRRRFLEAVHASSIDPTSRVRWLVTVRADFVDRPLADPLIGELFSESVVLLPAMSPNQLENVITGPAAGVGLGIEPTVVAELVRLGTTSAASLPVVQFTLTELVDRLDGRDVVTADDLAAIGGVEGAVARRAEAVFGNLDENRRAAARTVFGRLVSVAGGTPTRQRVRTADLTEAAHSVVEAFAEARLLAFDRDAETRESTVEIAHESLLGAWPRLRDWVSDDIDELRLAGRIGSARSAWAESDRDEGGLLRGAPLAAATALVETSPDRLSETDREFVSVSSQAQADADNRTLRQFRRTRRALVGVAVLLVAALAAGFVAVGQRDDARSASFEQESQRLALLAPELVASDPSVGLLVAAEAYRRSPGPETLGGLQRAMTATGDLLGVLHAGRPVLDVEWFDDETLALITADGVDIVDRATGSTGATVPLTPVNAGQAIGLSYTITAVSDDRTSLAVITATAEAVIIDRDGSSVRTPPMQAPVTAAAFGPGESLYLGLADGRLVETDRRSGDVLRERSAHPPMGLFELDPRYEPEPGRLAFIYAAVANRGVGAITTTGSRLVTAGAVDVTVWDRETMTPLSTSRGEVPDSLIDSDHTGPFLAYAEDLYPDPADPGRAFMTGGSGVGSIDLTSGDQEWRADATLLRALQSSTELDSDWNGELLVRVFDDGLLRIQELGETAPVTVVIDPGPGSLSGIAISPDGESVAVASTGGALLQSLTGDGLLSRGIPRNGAESALISHDGSLAGATTFDPGGTSVYTLIADRWTEREMPTQRDVRFIGAGQALPGILREWRNENWGTLRFLDETSLEPLGAWIPNAGLGNVITRADGGRGYITTDIDALITTGQPVIRSHDVPSGEVLGEAPGVGLTRFWGQLEPGGPVLAVNNGRLEAYDPETLTPVDPPFDAEGVHLLRIPGAGDRYYLLRVDGRLEIRNRATSSLIDTIITGEPADGDDPPPYVDEGRGLVLSALGKAAVLIDLDTGTRVGGTFPHDGTYTVLAANQDLDDGTLRLATAVGEHIKIWNLATETWFDIACQAAGRNLTLDEWNRLGPRDTEPAATCPQWDPPA